jgi:hypothetical protein
MSYDLDYLVIGICVDYRIKRHSRSMKEYERGKCLIRKFLFDYYDEAIKILASYVGI